ncbi:ExeM/NucH family extracellular endonuclease [Paraglaciecola sp. MB-3u-78]|jgi:predicted extracellular nuclease/endonuclease I|uniref:ExeM/NucH family extracellular endonuclease n=1 Tax=Paraglaciecola sp. MB-3u-78 TaxID=2058332 RepID=UPI000C3281B0|nr:ExeM/NucH family extracellular endonuclease [Paraglaciecola sp. MB-3u-78]PKG98712.1 endonuclease I [Paraglaciecola sp. MB-3u-78]
MKLKYPALLALIAASSVQASDIVITGVFDGPIPGGIPKGVELFVVNDIADLSVCGVGSANNGGGTDGQEFTFPATAATAGSYIYLASESPQFTAFFGFAPTYTDSAANINGDDAIELFCDGAVIDVFGDIAVDGSGTDWESLDGWAYRTAGTGPDGSTFVIANWSFSGVNGLEGGLTNDTTTSLFPLKSYSEEIDGGGDGGDTGEEPTAPCFNCPELETIAEASLFDDASYYATAITEVNASSPASFIKVAINQIISADHKDLSYSEVWTALTHTDEDPNNTDNVILWYTGRSMAKNLNGSGSQSTDPDNWNREHSWPQSHGFADLEESAEAYTDIHHLRPTDISVNQSRGNLDFDNSDNELAESTINRIDSDSFEPRDAVKGDVARMMFYMDTRYEGSDTTTDLQLVDRLTSIDMPELGRLCRLIEWHNADPVDAAEQLRNNTIYEFQGNRNPYIDHPEWVSILYQADVCSEDTGGGDTGGDTGGDSPINLFISEYVEGGSNNKAIEIYNNSSQAVDLNSVNVSLARFSNGSSSGTNIALTGTIPANGTYVIVNTSANADFKAKADQESGSVNHNGDDAYTLSVDGVVVDSFGQVGTDPGSKWGTGDTSSQNTTLVRKASIFTGDTFIDDAFDPAVQWIGFPQDTFSELGQHEIDNKELFFSEYIEGSGNNKALEIYNPNGRNVDLSTYSIVLYRNGATTGSSPIVLEGTLEGNDVFVIATNASTAAQEIKDAADQFSSGISHNGDDAYVLLNGETVIDSFGRVGEDPGSSWGIGDVTSANHTLLRKASITVGDVVIDDAFDPATEWDGLPSNDFSSIGSYGNGDTGGEVVDFGQCSDAATLIHNIQGADDSSPFEGETLIVEAVVTAAFEAIDGFFIQEENFDTDADVATSEGVFIAFSGDFPVVGSVVRVMGTVSESFGKTQINVSEDWLECGSGTATSATLNLPFVSVESAESLEGMLVTTNQELTVSDNFRLGRFGEVALSNGRLFIPTNVFLPGSSEAQALAIENSLNVVYMGDANPAQNPEPIIFPAGNLSAVNTLRSGDTVSSVTGVLDYDFGKYLINPTVAPIFAATNPRTAAPDLRLGNLKVASLNVLNFFNGDGQGAGFPTSRGADSIEEYDRQIAKTVEAIVIMDADIVGLMEIENDGFDSFSAIAQLAAAVNAAMGENVYSYVNAGGPVGTDAITVGLLYKNSVVSLSGAVDILNSDNSISDEQGPLFDTLKNRPAMSQMFTLTENGEQIVISVNHLKSKGSSCGEGDDDTTNGQGNCNGTRTRAATGLVTHLAQNFTDLPTLIIGDLNSYAKEQPITTIASAGYTNLVEYFQGSKAYSYTFNGELGYLDHALGNNKLLVKVVDVTEWHINADEPIVLDYNVEFQTETQQASLYAPDQYRMSDHDPVLIALQIDAEVSNEETSADVNADGSINFNDYFAILGMLGSAPGDANFNVIADYDGDGVISPLDLQAWYQLFLSQ